MKVIRVKVFICEEVSAYLGIPPASGQGKGSFKNWETLVPTEPDGYPYITLSRQRERQTMGEEYWTDLDWEGGGE